MPGSVCLLSLALALLVLYLATRRITLHTDENTTPVDYRNSENTTKDPHDRTEDDPRGFVPRSFASFLQVSDSNCSGALRAEDVPPNFRSLHFALQNNSPPSSLRLINAGSGSTGTSTLFMAACRELGLRGLHWNWRCNGRDPISSPATHAPTDLARWWYNITHCSGVPSLRSPASRQSDRCKSDYLLDRLHTSMRAVISREEVLMDSPVSVIYAEFADCFRDAIVVLTIREPSAWLRKRQSRHYERAVMCRPQWLRRKGVRHPFDLPGCLRQTEYANQALEHVFDKERIYDGYRKMNAYNAAVTTRLHVMCLWDAESSGDRATSELSLLWKYFEDTSRS